MSWQFCWHFFDTDGFWSSILYFYTYFLIFQIFWRNIRSEIRKIISDRIVSAKMGILRRLHWIRGFTIFIDRFDGLRSKKIWQHRSHWSVALVSVFSCRLGRADESVLYFKQALQRDTSFFPAYRNLHSASCALVERWHYRMLNDACRNEAYRTAIANKVSQGYNTVLDIGTGTGLFWWVGGSWSVRSVERTRGCIVVSKM